MPSQFALVCEFSSLWDTVEYMKSCLENMMLLFWILAPKSPLRVSWLPLPHGLRVVCHISVCLGKRKELSVSLFFVQDPWKPEPGGLAMNVSSPLLGTSRLQLQDLQNEGCKLVFSVEGDLVEGGCILFFF